MIMCLKTGQTNKTSSTTKTVTVSCGNCNSTGMKQLKHGKPGFEPRIEGGYRIYRGVWCIYPSHQCPACAGTGKRNVWNQKRPRKAVIADSITETDRETERIKGLIT